MISYATDISREADMRFVGKLRADARTFGGRRREVPFDLMRVLRHRPMVMLGVNAFELGQLTSNWVEGRLKALAQITTSALIGCPSDSTRGRAP